MREGVEIYYSVGAAAVEIFILLGVLFIGVHL